MSKKFKGLNKGREIVDYELTTLIGEKKKISDFLDKPLVLEVGSISCPMYAMHVSPMQEVVEEYPQFNFIVLYVREAHPAGKITAHKNLGEKLEMAQETTQFYGEQRTILVDDLDGQAHKMYGLMPNSIYIIDTNGIILFSKAWNNANYLKPVLDNILHNKSTDHLKFGREQPSFYHLFRTFRKTGYKALFDFIIQAPLLLWKLLMYGNRNR
ncbi:MAG: deiodinase-like protein [Thermonemataceae bacterium]